MVHGNQWATSTEISVATRILQSNINIWLQGDGQHNICFTNEEYINSSLSRNVDLLLHQNHFKLLIKILLNKTVISFFRQELQNSRKAMKINFQNCKASVAKIRNILLSFEYIRKENKHLNLNLIFIIVRYVSIYIRSFKRSKNVIRFFFWQTSIPSVFS